MPATKQKKELQHVNGQYRISCGYWVGRSGKRVPKVHMLGTDLHYARSLARQLKSQWEATVHGVAHPEEFGFSRQDLIDRGSMDPQTNLPIWTDTTVDLARDGADDEMGVMTHTHLRFYAASSIKTKEEAEHAYDDPYVIPIGKVGSNLPSVGTVEAAVKSYLSFLDTRLGVDLSPSNRHRQTETLGQVMEHVGKDCKLADLDYDALTAIVNHYKSLPPLKNKPGQRMAYYTAKTILQHLRQLLLYLEDTHRWMLPARWDRMFKFKANNTGGRSKIVAEKKRPVQVFTAEEIGKLGKAATTEREKFILLAGLNLAATQQQLAQLTFSDCVLTDPLPYIDLYRGKTGVPMMYDLWPLTMERVAFWYNTTTKDKSRNPDGLLILSEDDQPLVHYSKAGNKSDSVKQTWNRLLPKTDLPEDRRLSFSALRDTASDAALRLGGEAVQTQVLAHTPQSVARKHYTGTVPREHFQTANDVLRTWYETELRPQFEQQ